MTRSHSEGVRGLAHTADRTVTFIYMYSLVNGRPPAEADMQRFFEVTPPSVHNMIIELERRGLIRRVPRQPRSLEVIVPPAELPMLQPIKTSAARY